MVLLDADANETTTTTTAQTRGHGAGVDGIRSLAEAPNRSGGQRQRSATRRRRGTTPPTEPAWRVTRRQRFFSNVNHNDGEAAFRTTSLCRDGSTAEASSCRTATSHPSNITHGTAAARSTRVSPSVHHTACSAHARRCDVLLSTTTTPQEACFGARDSSTAGCGCGHHQHCRAIGCGCSQHPYCSFTGWC